jgi:hypothetical protein
MLPDRNKDDMEIGRGANAMTVERSDDTKGAGAAGNKKRDWKGEGGKPG